MKILLFFLGLIVFAFVLAVCILPFVNLASLLSLRRKVKQHENTIARLTAELRGLILTIGCILKLVTFDASGASTLTRVLAFIAGGLICFVISAAYTYAERRLLQRLEKNPSSGDENPPSCLSS